MLGGSESLPVAAVWLAVSERFQSFLPSRVSRLPTSFISTVQTRDRDQSSHLTPNEMCMCLKVQLFLYLSNSKCCTSVIACATACKCFYLWAFTFNLCVHKHLWVAIFLLRYICIWVHSRTQSGDLAHEALSIMVTYQRWGIREVTNNEEEEGGWAQDGPSIPQFISSWVCFMNDLLIVDLMESGGPAEW